MKLTLGLLVFGVLVFSIQAKTIILDENIDHYKMDSSIEIFEDRDKVFDAPDARLFNAPFVKHDGSLLSFGFTKSAYWVRFSLYNPSQTQQNRLLEIAYPPLDSVKLYVFDKDGGIVKTVVTGDSLPYNSREMHSPGYIFSLSLPPETGEDVYLRFETSGSMKFPVSIWSAEAFAQTKNKKSSAHGFYYGLMTVMFFYTLLLYFSLRNMQLFYYALYIISLLFYQMTLDGSAYQILWPNWPYWANVSLPVFMGLGVISTISVSQQFLKTKNNVPKIHTALNVIRILGAVVMIYSLMGQYVIATVSAMLLAALTALSIVVISIMSYKRGQKQALNYMIAWYFFFAGAIVSTLQISGFIPVNFFTENCLLIGSAITVMLLPHYISNQIHHLEKENEAQDQILETQRKLTGAYQRFVPEEILAILNKPSILNVNLGDQVERNMTILFSDINSFTNISESMTPEENFNFLNTYLEKMCPMIRSYGGFIDKYIGDAIMAIFSESVDDCVQAAITMKKILLDYNKNHINSSSLPIEVGIGINTGSLMFGIIGETHRMEGTVISDVVNMASRLVRIAKTLKTSILISDNTYMELENPSAISTRFIGRFKVKGKSKAVKIHEVFDPDPEELKNQKIENLEIFEKSVSYYMKKKYKQAIQGFQQCLKTAPNDSVSAIYLENCLKGISDSSGRGV
ncbi:MAG: hypothetical protein B0D92_03880 [Spirochaeta sp. LUC14_002_19_P3]|nr:MAG: hypothetical protein B0D92_03880 [Spirochaeta sp. LUC14_002_19_P3]